MELLETIARQKPDEEEVAVHLVTASDEYDPYRQKEYFEKIQVAGATAGIQFTWEFEDANSIHARHIVTDHGWKILLDRGLDVFQRYEMNDAFDFTNCDCASDSWLHLNLL